MFSKVSFCLYARPVQAQTARAVLRLCHASRHHDKSFLAFCTASDKTRMTKSSDLSL